MMKKRYILLILMIALMICGCATGSSESPPTEAQDNSQPVETLPAESQVTEPVTELTEAPLTEPDLSIAVPAGAHCRRIYDETADDYLDYYLFVPESAVKQMPMIIFLHGDGEVANISALETNVLIKKVNEIYGSEFPFIVLAPCTRSRSWISGTIPATLKNLIDTTVIECEIDYERIIITGFSRGSIGVWHMISTYGDYFSAAVPVSCGNETALSLENCVNVPILAFAGSGEENERRYYNAMSNNVNRIQQAGGNAQMILLDGLTHIQTPLEAYSPDTFRWMLEQ